MHLSPDLGSRRARRLAAWLQGTGLVGMMLIVLSAPAYVIAEAAIGRAQLKRDWTIEGPPCPVVETPARSVVGERRPRWSSYGDMRFARHFGHVSCVGIDEGRWLTREITRICQFSAPGAVTVETGRGRVTFQPGVAQPATVTVRRGVAGCVMGGWFRY